MLFLLIIILTRILHFLYRLEFTIMIDFKILLLDFHELLEQLIVQFELRPYFDTHADYFYVLEVRFYD